jgi:hypothetical protein
MASEENPDPVQISEPPRQSRMGLGWWVLLFITFLMVAGIAFFIGMFSVARKSDAPAMWNTSTVIKQVQGLSELVTVKYVLEKVVILEDARWYGESRVLLLAHGIVKAGIDMSELKPEDVVIRGPKITITLPMERITDAYLDEKRTHVIERSTGIVRQFDKDLEQNARRAAVADIRSAARYNGILSEARERAELQLKTMMLQLGFTEVEFKRPLPPVK